MVADIRKETRVQFFFLNLKSTRITLETRWGERRESNDFGTELSSSPSGIL
jgi:hypothetical protein